jgi:hypothetical protein
VTAFAGPDELSHSPDTNLQAGCHSSEVELVVFEEPRLVRIGRGLGGASRSLYELRLGEWMAAA